MYWKLIYLLNVMLQWTLLTHPEPPRHHGPEQLFLGSLMAQGYVIKRDCKLCIVFGSFFFFFNSFIFDSCVWIFFLPNFDDLKFIYIRCWSCNLFIMNSGLINIRSIFLIHWLTYRNWWATFFFLFWSYFIDRLLCFFCISILA